MVKTRSSKSKEVTENRNSGASGIDNGNEVSKAAEVPGEESKCRGISGKRARSRRSEELRNDPDSLDGARGIVGAFFDFYGVVNQNISSFNKFLSSYIEDIVSEDPIVTECHTTEPLPIRHEVHFTNVYINLPKRDEGDGLAPKNITPNDCLNRSLTYSAEMFARGHIIKCEYQNQTWVEVPLDDLELAKGRCRKRTTRKSTYEPLPTYKKPFFLTLGRIPVMVRSSVCHLSNFKCEEDYHARRECFLDPGGYFIINGKERVLVAQEKLPENRPVVYQVLRQHKFESECEILCSIKNSSRPVSALWVRLLKEKKVDLKKIFFEEAISSEDESLDEGEVLSKSSRRVKKPLDSISNKTSSGGNPGKTSVEKTVFDKPGASKQSKRLSKNLGEAPINTHCSQEETISFGNLQCGKQFVVVIPRLHKPIPLVLLLQALGSSGPEEIITFVVQGDGDEAVTSKIISLLDYSLDLWEPRISRTEALERIGSIVNGAPVESTVQERIDLARDVLNDFVLQNIGTTPESDWEKIRFICYMVRKVCEVHFGLRPPDERDNLINKRFELAGTLFLQLFKRLWKQMSFDLQRSIKRRLDMGVGYDIKDIIKPSIITNGFMFSVSTGNWAERKGATVSAGVSQELNRCSFVASLSHLRRVTTPSKLHRNVTARQLNLTNWGMICPNETPEGEPVGLVQNFALSACISVGCSEEPVLDFLKDHDLVSLMNCTASNMKGRKVFMNGKWIGVHPAPETIVQQLRSLRRQGKLNPEISVAILPYGNIRSEVHVQTDAGRIFRPLLVVENKKLKLTPSILQGLNNRFYNWKHLLDEGIIEQLDTAEISNCYIAMWESLLESQPQNHFTHCEIHPSMILGLSASTIPFANHNQAPRNTYQSGMAKQAVGLYATNFQRRCDLLAHVMHYPQKPLTTTFGAEMCNLWKLPAGQECIVAILSNGGYNQEDSIIVNQSSIERGLLRSSVYHAYVDIENRISAKREQDEAFERPGKLDVRVLKVDNYSHLEQDGLPAVGTRINEREVVIGKTSNNGGIKHDVSVLAKINTHAVVSQALVTTNEDGQRTHKVVLQETRSPKIGDKFASRHGQKGVIGMIYSQENMPFAKNGIVPDVILNPHAIPSRMTIGHLVEALAGKAICLSPSTAKKKIDGTAFTQPVTRETFSEFLTNKGYQKHGEEVLYNGATGVKLNATVFMGVNFYQRLRHMVDDKLNIRNRGAVTQLEGQPKRGLTREGAQRFGEMERDCTISHGAAAFLHERLFTVSDAAYYQVCNICGNLVSLNPFVNQELNQNAVYSCRLCDRKGLPSDDLNTIALPKAAKLLYQELVSMNIRPRFKTTTSFMRKESAVAKKQTEPSKLSEKI